MCSTFTAAFSSPYLWFIIIVSSCHFVAFHFDCLISSFPMKCLFVNENSLSHWKLRLWFHKQKSWFGFCSPLSSTTSVCMWKALILFRLTNCTLKIFAFNSYWRQTRERKFVLREKWRCQKQKKWRVIIAFLTWITVLLYLWLIECLRFSVMLPFIHKMLLSQRNSPDRDMHCRNSW